MIALMPAIDALQKTPSGNFSPDSFTTKGKS
jgi:hypothetical protein